MDIHNLLIAALGFWGLFQFWIVPSLSKSIPELVGKQDFLRIALHSAADAFCKLLLLISIVTAVSALGVAYLNSVDGVDILQAMDAVKQLESWQALMSGWNRSLGFFISLALIGALIYTSYRTGRKSLEELWEAKYKEEFDRLLKLSQSGELEELKPTELMQEVEAKLLTCNEALQESQENDPEAANSLREAISKLTQYYHFLDIERRIEVTVSIDEMGKPPQWMKIVRPFISRGALNTAKRGAAVLSCLLTLLLIPSFFALSAPTVKDAATERLVEMRGRLENLQLAASLDQAEREWQGIEEIHPPVSEEADWTEQDQSLADSLGAEFESNVVESRAYGQSFTRLSKSAIRTYARQEILNARASVDSRGQVINAGAGGSEAERSLSEIQFDSAQRQIPQTDVGRKFSGDLKAFKREQPQLWTEIGDKYKRYLKSFSEVPSPREIRGMLLSKSLGNLTGAVELDSYIGKVGEEIIADIPKDVANAFYKTTSKEFLVRLVNEPGFSQALKSMSAIPGETLLQNRLDAVSNVSNRLPSEKRLAVLWSKQPPSYQRTTSPALASANTQQSLDRYAAIVGEKGMLSNGVDSLASFADYFPGYDGAERKTAQATTRAKYSSTPISHSNVAVRSNALRARSFTRLRGFARVGGVLIGRSPSDKKQIFNLDQLQWRYLPGDQVEIQLTKGETGFALENTDSELIALAMAYAADGRPITATMVTASPLLELKILLHPTLEDTGVGCLATRLDQLVDEVTSNNLLLEIIRDKELSNITMQHNLYRFTWALRAMFLMQDPLSRSAATIEQIGLDDAIKKLAESNFKESVVSVDSAFGTAKENRAFMYAKSEFYQRELVSLIETCVNSTDLDTYADCVEEKIEQQKNVVDNKLYWAAPPPEYQPWSGVREAAYSLDENFGFAQWKATTSEFPLEFTYQISFTSPPFFVPSNAPWYADQNTEIENYFDSDPWELTKFKKLINAIILERYNTDSEYENILSSMAKFTILQRVFRAGLEGFFGDDFSTANMIELAKRSSQDITSNPTRRWLSRAGNIEKIFLNRVEENLADAPKPKRTAEQLADCDQLSNSTKDVYGLASLSVESWDGQCLLNASYAGEELAQLSERVSLVRQFRHNLGVVAEDLRWREKMTCSASYQ